MKTQNSAFGTEWFVELLEKIPITESIKDINTLMRIPGFNKYDLESITNRGVRNLKEIFNVLYQANITINPEDRSMLQEQFSGSSYNGSRTYMPHEAIYQLSTSLFEALPEFEIFLKNTEKQSNDWVGYCLIGALNALNSEGERLSNYRYKHKTIKEQILYPIKKRNIFFCDPLYKYRPNIIAYSDEALRYLKNSNLESEEWEKKEVLQKIKCKYEKIRQREEVKSK